MITDDPGTPDNGHFENNFAFSFDVTKSTAVMAESHGTSRTNFARDILTVNVGLPPKANRVVHSDYVTRP